MNISDTIAPKVDQLTADHLIGRTMTIRITGVRLTGAEQPCDINYEGDGGLPYRPGKSMRRVLVHVWGGDVNKYVGRSMTLYRDDDVQFGGLKVGGIRISHMSHIEQPVIMALTAKKGSKKAFKVQPLKVEAPAAAGPSKAQLMAEAVAARIDAAADVAAMAAITSDPKVVEQRAWLADKRPELADWLDGVVRDRLAALDAAAGGDDDTFPGDLGSDTTASAAA
jgi:hypothetical protein